jgi:hypothetical protein
VARQADNAISAGGSAATRGTKVHTEFDTALKNGAGGKNISPESAYLNRVPDERYRPRGSSNPDAVVGNIRQPTAVFDLKTGKSGISNSQMAKYNDNLPEGTPIFTVTPNGHNAPRPQSMSGMGAVLNTGSLLGGSLYGDDSVPYLGGNSGGGLVDPRLYNCQVPSDHKVCDETDRGEWCTTDSWSAWEFYLGARTGGIAGCRV